MSAHRADKAHRVEGTTLVAAPAPRVWQVLSDFHNVDHWAEPVTRVVDTGPTRRDSHPAIGPLLDITRLSSSSTAVAVEVERIHAPTSRPGGLARSRNRSKSIAGTGRPRRKPCSSSQPR